MTVMTVTGPIASDQVGRALMHEHVMIGMPGAEHDPLYATPRDVRIERAVRRLVDLKSYGVTTIVDASPIEVGRDVEFIREAAEKAAMQIVCSTGFYFEGVGLPFYWRLRTSEEIAELYIREIEKGVAGTSIRPGVIKCGTSAPVITRLEEKFLEAVCIAQKQTGVCILTHTQDGTCGPEQARFFTDRGVPPEKCVIGHSCASVDSDYHARILRQGAFIGFDRIGHGHPSQDVARADCIARIVKDGRVDQIILSQDKAFVWVGRYPLLPNEDQRREFDRLRETDSWPEHPRYIFTDFLPLLRKRGVTEEEINKMMVDNPKNYFS
jgi:phosphotriesterase-related protein